MRVLIQRDLPPLRAILLLQTAIFPDNFKTAIITPIHKCGSRAKFTNYRPIALLPILSKILEKILNNVILSFIVMLIIDI